MDGRIGRVVRLSEPSMFRSDWKSASREGASVSNDAPERLIRLAGPTPIATISYSRCRVASGEPGAVPVLLARRMRMAVT